MRTLALIPFALLAALADVLADAATQAWQALIGWGLSW